MFVCAATWLSAFVVLKVFLKPGYSFVKAAACDSCCFVNELGDLYKAYLFDIYY